MNEFEEHLTARLRNAAATVVWPEERELSPASTRRTRSTRGWAVAAGMVAAASIGGVVWAATTLLTPQATLETQCANVLEWNSITYSPHGEQLRVPTAGRALTPTATRVGCDDGNGDSGPAAVPVTKIKNLPPEQGFLAEGVVYISDEAGPAAAALAADLNAELPCPLTKPSALTGQVLGILPARPASDDLPSPPYVLNFQATSGAGLPWDAYSALTIQIQVTSATEGSDQVAAITRSLSQGAPLQVTTECRPGYTALSIQGN